MMRNFILDGLKSKTQQVSHFDICGLNEASILTFCLHYTLMKYQVL